jgi:hypothetical protein
MTFVHLTPRQRMLSFSNIGKCICNIGRYIWHYRPCGHYLGLGEDIKQDETVVGLFRAVAPADKKQPLFQMAEAACFSERRFPRINPDCWTIGLLSPGIAICASRPSEEPAA